MNNVFLDIGANNGSSSIHLAQSNPKMIFFAFEPTPKLYNELVENTNYLENYHVINKAVSNYEGTSYFYIAGHADWGCSSLLEFSESSKTEWPGRTDFSVTERISVDVITLEKFINEKNITLISYLHVDTQGSDLNVLIGLKDKIEIVVEGVIEAANKKNILYNNQNTLDDSVSFLESKGFLITNVESNDVYQNEVNIFFKNKKFLNH